MSNPSRTIQRIAGVLLAASAVVGPAASAANPERPSPERPYGGSCSTVIVPITPPATVPQQLHLEYECQLAHMGRATAQVTQFVTPTGQSGHSVSLLVQNTTVYTSANGDQLTTIFVGSGLLNLQSGEVAFTGVETFAGGTGRFQAATGSSQLEGTASIFTNRGFFTSRGRIAF